MLSGSARKRRRIDTAREDHTVTVETSIGANDAEMQLLLEAGQLPRSELLTGALSGQAAKTLEDEKHDTNRRRSTRLEMLDRGTGLAKSTKSFLGKRGRDTCTNELREVDKRSTYGDGSITSTDIEVLKSEGLVQKRARCLNKNRESDKPSTPEKERKPVRKSMPKRWLSHGLYIGQDQITSSRVSQKATKLKRSLDECSGTQHRKFLPMPMFGGQRMIEMGRDFKLPFDVFSPPPPGQPRPEEWKKIHKSEYQVAYSCFADTLAQMFWLAKPSTCGKKPSLWNRHNVFVHLKVGAAKSALIVSCSTSATTRTAILEQTAAPTAALVIYGNGQRPAVNITSGLTSSKPLIVGMVSEVIVVLSRTKLLSNIQVKSLHRMNVIIG